ncbi:protein of unknown function [Magnetospirillum sp. XM-1]|nr:protein of unknown function [Magnetospirillum sp. XM-1]
MPPPTGRTNCLTGLERGRSPQADLLPDLGALRKVQSDYLKTSLRKPGPAKSSFVFPAKGGDTCRLDWQEGT